jgi:hypothetical protein
MTDEERLDFLSSALKRGEIEFGFDGKFTMYFGYSTVSRYVLGSTLRHVIDEMAHEAARYSKLNKRPDPLSWEQFKSYLYRRHRRLFHLAKDDESEH